MGTDRAMNNFLNLFIYATMLRQLTVVTNAKAISVVMQWFLVASVKYPTSDLNFQRVCTSNIMDT